MFNKSRSKSFWRASVVMLLLTSAAPLLSACGDDSSPQSFAPLNYSYLGQLHLNVAHIDILDQAPPGSTPGDISGKAPTPPDQALQQLTRDRLGASGGSGNAVFTITHASILHEPGGTLQGDLEAHIDILTATGEHAGYAQAHVSRTLNPGGEDAESRKVLYDLTSQMMQDMNVELEYQIKKSLRDWLVDAGGAPLAGAIQQQNLSTSGSAVDTGSANAPGASVPAANATPVEPPTAAASPAATTEAAPASAPSAPQTPDAIFPTGGDDAAGAANSAPAVPKVHSPQPGVLSIPGNTQ